MKNERKASVPIHKIASENIGRIVEFVENYAAAERERAGGANEPDLAVLRQRLEFLYERYQRQLKEARAFVDACRQGNGWLTQAGYLSVAALLTGAGFAFALVTIRPFNLGQAGDWFCAGLAIMLPFAVHRFLGHFRNAWVHNMLVIAPFLAGVLALVYFAEVRGDVMAHALNAGAAVVLGNGELGEPPPAGGDEQQVFLLLRQAMIFAALGFELASGLAFFGFCEARRNNDQGRRERLEIELNRTINEILVVSREIHELTAQPSREYAELCQQLQQSVLDRINRPRNGGLGVVVVAALLSAATLKGADRLNMIGVLDLSQSQTVAYSGRSELEENRDAIAVVLSRLPPGASVTVIGITDHTFVNPSILLSAELTTDAGYFNSRLTAGRRQLIAEWQKRSRSLTASFKTTDILGAIQYAGEVFGRTHGERKVLVIFSDARQYSAELDLETPVVIQVDASMARVRKRGLESSLAGVEVFVFGAGDHTGKRATAYTATLKDFWCAYVKEAGGNLVAFSTTREPRALQLVTAHPAGGTSP